MVRKKTKPVPKKSTKKRKKPIPRPAVDAHPTPLGQSVLPRVFTDDLVIQAIRLTHGLIYAAAKLLDCTAQTIYNRIKGNLEIKRVLIEERGRFSDLAENVLWESVNRGDVKSAMWVLERLRRNRYVTRTESRIGGDKNAPPVKTESLIALDDLPLELRIAILDAVEKKEANREAAEGSGRSPPESEQ